ncbi:hypothetical protein ALI144C_00555 [Actinosynnema sp. ALI-1.44]|uniref:hypothetical protein n=1 Tax=Actinosynnema sp. ALI-1.44 TaxID=1933779 RepID=UPI00097BF93D|nr:hypothetical protein [Actinosynnema sp. ALI-1.44]ONI91767.1 hypothetical protein ALI144C_00555 [Actinosynnema sp. ALI-1.44]
MAALGDRASTRRLLDRFEPVLPPLLAGERSAAASLPASGLEIPKGAIGDAFLALGKPQSGEGPDFPGRMDTLFR